MPQRHSELARKQVRPSRDRWKESITDTVISGVVHARTESKGGRRRSGRGVKDRHARKWGQDGTRGMATRG